MAKICKNCACYEVCFMANPCRSEDCNIGWQPIVVLCKDCKYFTKGMAVGMCKRNPEMPIIPIPYNHFCSFGERKDNDEKAD